MPAQILVLYIPRRKKWDEAIEEFKKAISNPKYQYPQSAHYNLGLVYINKNDLQKALKEFETAIRVQPNFEPAYFQMGQVYDRMGKRREAIINYLEAIRINPGLIDAHYYLGLAYYKEGSKKLAVEEFKKVIEAAPESEFAASSKRYLNILK